MTADQQNSLLQLFTAYTEGTITPADHQKLQTMLRSDREAREFWFLQQDLELGLKRLTAAPTLSDEDSAASFAEKRLTETDRVAPPSKLEVVSATLRRSAPGGFWHNRRNQVLVAVSSLCLVAMFVLRIDTDNRSVDGIKSVDTVNSPDVVLESPTHGTRFAISETEGKIVALHFLLKTECPFCLKLIHDYSQIGASDSNVVHLFIKPDSAAEIIAWARHINLDGLEGPPVVYRDPESRLAKQFHIPDGYQFHGQPGHYPALVALDPSGKELFRYVGSNNTDRMQPADFHARLAQAVNHN